MQWGNADLIRFRRGEYSRADLAFIVALYRLVHAESNAVKDAGIIDAERRNRVKRGK